MKLLTETVSPGDWIVVSNSAPGVSDLTPQYISLDTTQLAAFVDGTDLRTRCPEGLDNLNPVVSVRGEFLGRLNISVTNSLAE